MPFQLFLVATALVVASVSFAAELARAGDVAAPGGVLPPTIINVEPTIYSDEATVFDRSRKETAERALLLREFPDDLVERMWLQDWTDLERAHQVGQLVDVPSDPVGRGIVLRLQGSSRIGELVDDPYRQMLLCRLTKPAAGLLYRIASRLRLMEGEEYKPLEVTSLVRTWDYQLRLSDVNPNADRSREGVPPTHVLGVAFDIARTQMSAARQERIEFLFAQLAADGELAYYKEGSSNGLMHYHVIALPSAAPLLVRDFERQSVAAVEREEVFKRHHYLPESPCVMFGSSLEPFSAICSCEMPVEALASAFTVDAPISH